MEDGLRMAIIRANPQLSRFNPLERILFHDDFDNGLSGWTELIGNYFDKFGNANNDMGDCRPPMLSSASMWDTGTAGAFQGTYSLKIATRPTPGHLAKALKRMTFQAKRRMRCEAFFTYRAEASRLQLDEEEFHAFGTSYDIQDEEKRYWPAIRYLNAENGKVVGKWQYHVAGDKVHAGGWEDVPNGQQLFCYNEILTKQNWHYLRWDIDLRNREYIELQCNDRSWDLRGKGHRGMPAMPNLWCLMNLGFWAETDRPRRSFLFLDSVVLSTED
ncbi:MAG: DUF6772 family protein [Chloroflexota bacterium]